VTHQYENLGPEKFQQFCQALLAREFPRMQCFPVGQPDGGRDATSYYPRLRSEGFIVFQVKYVRNPQAETDPHRWLAGILEAEALKVKELIARGAKEYRVLTNVQGTSHLDSGSIDRVDQIFKKYVEIPSQCWWRDDLDRRLDNAWDLKWAYPEVMAGPDFIRAVVESGLSEHRERRAAAMRAFLVEQYEIDKEVRFKQVELQNKLLELFVDVPIAYRRQEPRARRIFHSIVRDLSSNAVPAQNISEGSSPAQQDIPEEVFRYRDDLPPLGASTFLLHALAQRLVPRMVLEGAPGQGKSTIVQYVCQVHRMRLLDLQGDLALVPAPHARGPLRVPIKIDLRDFATWLIRRDPLSPGDSTLEPPTWQRSLESFLAFLVARCSGGAAFGVDDFIAVAKVSSLLLVLDGLDEVAEISRRREVIEEIRKGVRRMAANCASLQVVVTSRPAAFANSPGFPEEEFAYYHLEPVTRQLVAEYADKWLRARRITEREGAEVKRILQEKLHEAHIRELAKNPMQLAILLSLIHTRGESLPDKRTALYDSYIDPFFSREAAKSPIVREHRELLIDIHRYLAWTLHADAEQGQERGSISGERLERLLSEYLQAEEQDVSLARTLFTGMVERVVAIVSRVEGTYEFEVQPLREYFAARHLYDTAPYSPPGNEKRGTKPDRFDAIARNFYWLNVARFYAGCFSKGELASLAERLQELVRDKGFRNTGHPRLLALTLLSDWVFTQHPKLVRQVLDLAFDDNGLPIVLASVEGHRSLVLPGRCGGDEFVRRCLKFLRKSPRNDSAMAVLELLTANAPRRELKALWWKEASETHGRKRSRWFSFGIHLGVLREASAEQLTDLLADDPLDSARLGSLLSAGRSDLIESDENRSARLADAVLDARPLGWPVGNSLFDQFVAAVQPYHYTTVFEIDQSIPLEAVWKERPYDVALDPERFIGRIHGPTLEKCLATVSAAKSQSARPISEWATHLDPWNGLIEVWRGIWGDRPAFVLLANVACRIKSSEEKYIEFSDLLDHSQELCKRCRHARLRAGSVSWWKTQISRAMAPSDSALVCALLLSWASPGTLRELCEDIQPLLDHMDDDRWRLVIRCIQLAARPEKAGRRGSLKVHLLPARLSARTTTALGVRLNGPVARELYRRYLLDYRGRDSAVLQFCQEQALDMPHIGTPDWKPDLEQVASTYALDVLCPSCYSIRAHVPPGPRALSPKIRAAIMQKAKKFPLSVVSLAESACRFALGSQSTPVGEVARRDGWFTP
jgi:hypothetical protein